MSGQRSFQLNDERGKPAVGWDVDLAIQNPSYCGFCREVGAGYTPNGLFHFFGLSDSPNQSLRLWNAPDIWRQYFDLSDEWISIAEDAFGFQYCIRRDGRRPVVKIFSIWSGQFGIAANNFDEFVVETVFNNGAYYFEKLYVRVVQKLGSAGRTNRHLSPCTPPLLGGKIENASDFEWMDAIANASMMGQIYRQVRMP